MKRTALATAFVTLFAGQSLAQTISIGTNPQGSLAYASGSAIADIVGDATGTSFTVVPQGGPTAIIPAMSAGEFQFSFAAIVPAALAMKGVGPFKGRPQPTVRVAAIVYPLQLAVFARDDAGIKSFADLKGKRVASRFTSQKNLGGFLKVAMGLAGINYKDTNAVPVQNGGQAVNELIEGALDATMFSVGSGLVQKADASVGVRFLSLPNSTEVQEALAKKRPGAKIVTIKKGSTPGADDDTNIIQLPFVVLTSTDVKDDLVYKVVKAMAENQAKLADKMGRFKAMSLKKMANSGLPVPYHPGAIKYYKEAGVWAQ